MANFERTGWRDEAISSQHRRWGVLCHACDLDFLLVEHCYGVPAALVEYKALGVDESSFRGANVNAVRLLADAVEIPFVVAIYDPVSWGVRIYPQNMYAQRTFDWGAELTEEGWVQWLHAARGLQLERRTRGGLNTELPRRPLARAG